MNGHQDQAMLTTEPDNIDEIVIESHSIWITVSRKYKSIAARNKQLQEYQLNLNKRLANLTEANLEQVEKIKKLEQDISNFKVSHKKSMEIIAELQAKLKKKTARKRN